MGGASYNFIMQVLKVPAIFLPPFSAAVTFALRGGGNIFRRWVTSKSPFKNILLETRGVVRVVRINRPAQRNCVNRETARELYSAFREFEEDEKTLVAVLTGEGGNFCAGYDLKELASADHVDIAPYFKAHGEAPMVGVKLVTTSYNLSNLVYKSIMFLFLSKLFLM